MAASATELAQYQMYIGGKWIDALSGETFESYNPFTAQPWALIPRAGASDVDRAVQAAYRAFTQQIKRVRENLCFLMRIRSVAGIFSDRYPCVRSNRVVRGIHNYITHHEDDGIHRSVPGRDCTGR